jgi:hypothetical protein
VITSFILPQRKGDNDDPPPFPKPSSNPLFLNAEQREVMHRAGDNRECINIKANSCNTAITREREGAGKGRGEPIVSYGIFQVRCINYFFWVT